jgi:Tfp pilus assembly protein PilZ
MDDIRSRRIRAPYKCEITLKSGDQTLNNLRSRNISMSGTFIETKEKFKIGDECLLTIQLNTTDLTQSLNIKCKVVRLDPAGIGLTFIEMDSDSFVHLREVVKFNVNNPDAFLDQ